MNKPELKLCPFCGGKAVWEKNNNLIGNILVTALLALYIDREGGMFDLQIKTKDETTVGFKTVIDSDNYTFSDVFLTKEDAEKALKECENNG